MRDSVVFYKTFYDCIKELPEESGYILYNAVCEYAFNGTEPDLSGLEAGIFGMIKVQIDANNKRYENGKKGAEHGKKGGRPKKGEESDGDAVPEKEETPKGIPCDKAENPKGDITSEKEETPNENDNVNENENIKKETPNGVKKSIITVSKETVSQADVRRIMEKWNTLNIYGISPISKLNSGSKRYELLVSRVKQYSIQDVLAAIDRIKDSDFLQGKSSKGWTITFDWFVRPNNFPKVLEGNYDNRNGGSGNGRIGGNDAEDARDPYARELERMLGG